MRSGLDELKESKAVIILAVLEVTWMSLSFESVLERKAGKELPNSSR